MQQQLLEFLRRTQLVQGSDSRSSGSKQNGGRDDEALNHYTTLNLSLRRDLTEYCDVLEKLHRARNGEAQDGGAAAVGAAAPAGDASSLPTNLDHLQEVSVCACLGWVLVF